MKNGYMAAGLILSVWWSVANAGLACEQLVAIAQTTVGMRNQGMALNVLLADVERKDMKSKFTAAELGVIRRTITLAYTGEVSPFEISQSCRQDGK
jgi:hypothetical protein